MAPGGSLHVSPTSKKHNVSAEENMSVATTPPVKRILVTGAPGVGKTTLVTRVFEKLRNSHPQLKVQGFYTKEIRHSGERTGFEIVTVDGRSAVLSSVSPSSYDSTSWPTVGKYKVDVRSFESLALPELQVKNDTGLIIVDEIGKMELFSSSFFPTVLAAFDSNVPILASIPIPKFGRDIPEVARIRNRADASLYTLNKSNRDSMMGQIYSQLDSLMRSN